MAAPWTRSELLDKPAGKHGWVRPQGEGFVFEKTGKPVRFFGINIVAGANFPTHEQAEDMAELLSQMGVNMTRHHHADAPWATHNFFGKGPSTHANWTPSSMDRFDYLDSISCNGAASTSISTWWCTASPWRPMASRSPPSSPTALRWRASSRRMSSLSSRNST